MTPVTTFVVNNNDIHAQRMMYPGKKIAECIVGLIQVKSAHFGFTSNQTERAVATFNEFTWIDNDHHLCSILFSHQIRIEVSSTGEVHARFEPEPGDRRVPMPSAFGGNGPMFNKWGTPILNPNGMFGGNHMSVDEMFDRSMHQHTHHGAPASGASMIPGGYDYNGKQPLSIVTDRTDSYTCGELRPFHFYKLHRAESAGMGMRYQVTHWMMLNLLPGFEEGKSLEDSIKAYMAEPGQPADQQFFPGVLKLEDFVEVVKSIRSEDSLRKLTREYNVVITIRVQGVVGIHLEPKNDPSAY